jgi:hypothetical protein
MIESQLAPPFFDAFDLYVERPFLLFICGLNNYLNGNHDGNEVHILFIF